MGRPQEPLEEILVGLVKNVVADPDVDVKANTVMQDVLDSLAIVGLVADVEVMLQDEFGKVIPITEDLIDQEDQTIRTFAGHLEEILSKSEI